MYTAESNEGRKLTIYHSEAKYRSAVSTREASQYSEEIQQGVFMHLTTITMISLKDEGALSNINKHDGLLY